MKSDQELRSDVEHELLWDPSLHAEQIGVSVRDGVVELSGHVASYLEKWAAESAAMRVSKTRALASEIKVDMPASATRTDADIARASLHQIEWNSSIPDTVKVQVTDGCVTLAGAVEWQYQKEAAERAVRPLRGVRSLTNDINVTPKSTSADMKIDIEKALQRNASINATDITVETVGTKVILRGYVRSWAERDEAKQIAWAAPGIMFVEDLILIRQTT